MWAQVRGNSQGAIKISANAVKRSQSSGKWAVDLETHISAHIDGQQQYGMVVIQQAAALAVQKALSSSIGIVGVSNISSSTGAIG